MEESDKEAVVIEENLVVDKKSLLDKIPLEILEKRLVEFREAYSSWAASNIDTRGKFNPAWLRKKGYKRLYFWATENGGIRSLVDTAGGEISKNFDIRETEDISDTQSALNKLQEAHTKWKSKDKSTGNIFNQEWLTNNGYFGIVSWPKKNGGINKLLLQSSEEIRKDFKFRSVVKRTPAVALIELRKAYEKWSSEKLEDGRIFNVSWLEDNGYRSLYTWSRRHGGIDTLVNFSDEDIKNAFQKGEVTQEYTQELAISKLKILYEFWVGQKDITKEKFGPAWLQKNSGGLYNWAQNNGGIDKLVETVGGEVQENFERERYKIDKLAQLKIDFTKFLEEMKEKGSEQSKKFQFFINIFGSSRAADILFKFRPEFKGLPVEYVKGIMAEYLGDTLSNPGKFKPADIKDAVEFLSDATFEEALFETIKENCLKYYFAQKQQGGRDFSGYEVVYSYIDHLFTEIGEVKSDRLDDIVQRVVEYYDSVLRHFHKPEGFVDKLSAGREFPDINQRINMKELQEKKRLLIADEMGLGKSASVIMAKEQLGVKCAVIVAPSNVIDTWQRYLSDEKTPGGYFQEGKAPRVLRVENVKDLQGITADQYDYILLSQGLLKSNYVQHLKNIDYDMMIVDEVHKLKRMDGKRSEALLELSSKIQGEDKYLALLSGTPVPNKVKDLAINLKLLYPEKFADYDNNELVYQIINGDIIDLRSLLIPRMQMKSLEDGVELPPMTEETIKIELSELEKEVYEVLLEDDEVTPTEKIQILRQFLLNPELVDATPGLESAKQNKLSERLSEAFAKEDKILMFVNGYVGNVIHGEKSIFNSVQIPPGVELRFVYGDVEGKERTRIQDEFNTSNKKILLVVSGQTADVGVDYSAAQRVIFYNEPWTVYDKKQQISRAYRQGLKHPLQVDTFITDLTIEEGMQEYVQRKFGAIEKLLRGVPVTEMEKELLKSGEKTNEDDASVDPEFAKYYFSSLDRILRFFGYVKGIGEHGFKEFLSEHGGEYAGAYIDLGSRSYQANANRVAGTLMHEFIESRGLSDADRKEMKILDMASGPEMLRHHIADKYKDNVVSVDINKEHFKKGAVAAVGSILALPFGNESFDYANFALSLHYTNFVPSKGKLERLQALMEMNRVLKVGGRGVVNMIYSLDFKDFDKFKEIVAEAGFQVVEEYTGEAELGDSYKSTVITLEKVRSLNNDLKVEDVNEKLTAENREGLKFRSNKKKLKDSKRVLTEFSLNGKSYKTKLNKEDIEIFVEEQQIMKQGETLKKAYEGKIENIPRAQVLSNGFVRILVGKKYVLFKKMIRGSGVVIVK